MNHKSLLIATHNKGKRALLQKLLAPLPHTLVSLDDIGITHDIEETGTTYEENATLKAETYSKLADLPAIADDGGLEVDALGGAPGIYSARYAGTNTTDAQKVAFLLKKLEGVPEGKRNAQFVAVLAVADPGNPVRLYRGTVKGHISLNPRGKPHQHLPYRQIFIPEGHDKTLDELDDEGTLYVSHRQKAFQQLLDDLKAKSG